MDSDNRQTADLGMVLAVEILTSSGIAADSDSIIKLLQMHWVVYGLSSSAMNSPGSCRTAGHLENR